MTDIDPVGFMNAIIIIPPFFRSLYRILGPPGHFNNVPNMDRNLLCITETRPFAKTGALSAKITGPIREDPTNTLVVT